MSSRRAEPPADFSFSLAFTGVRAPIGFARIARPPRPAGLNRIDAGQRTRSGIV